MKVKNQLVKTITQAQKHLTAGDFSCVDLVESIYDKIKERSSLNAYVNVREKDEVLQEAE